VAAKSRRAIARSDAVTLVLDALTNHRDDSPEHQSVHQKGTGVIDNLAVSCALLGAMSHFGPRLICCCVCAVANRESIRTLGAVPIIIMSMNTYPDDSDIQQNACGALWNLSVYPSEPDMEGGAFSGVARVCVSQCPHPCAHCSCATQRAGSVTLSSVEELWRLCEHCVVTKVLVWCSITGWGCCATSLASTQVGCSLDVYRSTPCQCGGCMTVVNVRCVSRERLADDSGLVDVVLGAMRANETHVGVQEQGCAALAELAAKGGRTSSATCCKRASGLTVCMRAHAHPACVLLFCFICLQDGATRRRSTTSVEWSS